MTAFAVLMPAAIAVVLTILALQSTEPARIRSLYRLAKLSVAAFALFVSVGLLMFGTDSVWFWRGYYFAGIIFIEMATISVARLSWRLAAEPGLLPVWLADWEGVLAIELRFATIFIVAVGLALSGAFLLWGYQGSVP